MFHSPGKLFSRSLVYWTKFAIINSNIRQKTSRVFERLLGGISRARQMAEYHSCKVYEADCNGLGRDMNLTSSKSGRKPLFTFGIITDVQYGDVDDRLNFEGSAMRYYRNSVNLLKNAIAEWRDNVKPDFVLQLGDIIEGNHVARKDREKTLKTVMDCCLDIDCYFCHLWGNHEFYLYSRNELAKTQLNSKVFMIEDGVEHSNIEGPVILINNISHRYNKSIKSGDKYYYAFSPHPMFKFIALDSYDISICGREKGSRQNETAVDILSKNNNNPDWNSPVGLPNRYFVKFNGGFSEEQLKWLDEELTVSDEKNQKVVILSHVPIYFGGACDLCLAWNYQEALEVIQKHSCVKVCFYGHTHIEETCVDRTGVYHVTYPAVLECNADQNAFATVSAYEDKLEITGYGVVKSCTIEL